MEIDNGARRTIISERTYRRQFSHMLLRAKIKLRTYDGGHIPVTGQTTAMVDY